MTAAKDHEPFCVEPGWIRSVVPNAWPDRGAVRVLFYGDGVVRIEHRCDRGERGTIICAPALQLGQGHTVVQEDPLTITPSILCPDCGLHGFVTDGRWHPC